MLEVERVGGDNLHSTIVLFPRQKISGVQQLQVLEIVMSFYQREETNDWAQHYVFKAMFSGNLSPARTDFLAKLVSMAIGVKNKAVLDCSAVWMQVSSFSMIYRVHFLSSFCS